MRKKVFLLLVKMSLPALLNHQFNIKEVKLLKN